MFVSVLPRASVAKTRRRKPVRATDSVPVVTPCRPTYACPQILPSASYKSRNHCSSKLSDGARGGTFMYWAMVYLVELAGAAIHELDPERRLPRPRRSRDQDDVPRGMPPNRMS